MIERPTVYPNSVTFDAVMACYPDCKIIGVWEVFANGKWSIIDHFFNATERKVWTVTEQIQRLIDAQGATVFNLQIRDQFGEICYPDFRAKELQYK
jgi:hypothetical protein